MYSVGLTLYNMFLGYHPLYITGGILSDNSHTLKQKVAAIETELWHYPDYVSPMAKDLICKLCRINQIERYDAKRALQHPFITRNYNEKIPMTKTEEMQMFNIETGFQKVIRAMYYLAVVNPKNR